MNIISEAVKKTTVGSETVFENLAMVPLVASPNGQADYLVLDEALAQGLVRIAETSEAGTVPELLFINEGEHAVLLLDGEELVGAKQNRVLNLTVLAPAKQNLRIPVSCVEAGRWSSQSRDFCVAPRAQYAQGRARKMDQVSQSLRGQGRRVSNQSAVWADIDMKAHRLHTDSATSAMSDIFEQHRTRVEDYVKAFVPLDRQVGALFAINGSVIGFDLFDCESTLRKLLPKLVRSYALDAIDVAVTRPERTEKHTASVGGQVPEFLQRVSTAEAATFPAIGMGEDVRLCNGHLTGAALVVEGRVVHLSVFHLDAGERQQAPRAMTSASARRHARQSQSSQ